MSVEGSARRAVVDLSQPGGALAVEIDVSEAAELLMSMCTLSGDQDLDTFELGRERLEQIAAAAPESLMAAAEDILAGSELLPAHLLGLVYTTPKPRTIDAFLARLARTEPIEIQLHLLGYYMRGHHITDDPETIRRAAAGDPAARDELLEATSEWQWKHRAVSRLLALGADEVKERLLDLLPRWNEHVFQAVAAEALPLAERDAEAKQRLAGTLSPEQLVDRAASGLQYAPRPDVHKLVFFPTYWQRPWVLLGEYRNVKIYCYPISIDHEQGPDADPAQLARTYKALADENRLRLLKLLQSRPLTVTEAAQQLELAKSTAHHHLAILRQAGFVLVRDEDDKLYSLRSDLLPQAGALLAGYLRA